MAAEAEAVLLTEEAVARPMAVEAVLTVIDKISASQQGPAPHQRGGPFLFSSPLRIEKPAHNSLFACVFNE